LIFIHFYYPYGRLFCEFFYYQKTEA